VLYCLVGGAGLIVHLSILWFLYRYLSYSFGTALLVAIGVALVANYTLNNTLTFRQRSRKGWRFLTGLLFYAVVCSVGNFANYVIAAGLAERGIWWPLATVCGLAVGSVWNFAASEIVTWRTTQR
jgi:dolichol-phosphate mannosyltransferase